MSSGGSPPPSPVHAERLAHLRTRLAERGVDGLFLPRTDEQGSEYLPASAERVAWLTGFTGSAAQVVVLKDKAAVFTAIAREGFELLGAAMAGAVAGLDDQPARVRVGAIGRAYVGFAIAHPAHFEVMWRNDLASRNDPTLHAAADATFDQLMAGVRAAQAAGRAAGADDRSVAYLAWSSVHGLAVLWLNGQLQGLDPRSFDEVADAVGTLLNDSLAAYAVPPAKETDDD